MLVYGLAWTCLLPILVLLAYTVVPKWRDGIKQRLSVLPDDLRYKAKSKRIWFHAVSVGELNALLPLLKCFQGADIVLSTGTSSAQAIAKTKLSTEIKEGEIKVIYMPWDHPWLIKRALKLIKPYALITVETEIWPALFSMAHAAGVRIAIVNARLNDASYKAYKALAWFIEPVFTAIDLVLAQSASDSRRFLELGTGSDKVYMLGNIKFSSLPLLGRDQGKLVRKTLGYADDVCILLAASTHEEEEAALINIFQELKLEFPQLRLVLAPRRPERFYVVEQLILSAAQLQVLKYSEIKKVLDRENNLVATGVGRDEVLLVDTLGDLSTLTAIADIAFVGGTLVANVGGHNVLEPAAYGLPVLVGVNYYKNVEIVEMMEAEGALEVAQSIEELRLIIRSIVEDDDKRVLMGARAMNAMKKNRRVLEDTAIKLNEFLNPATKI